MKTKLFTLAAAMLFGIANAQDGTVDTGFNPGTGIDIGPSFNVLKEQPDGKVLIGSNMSEYNSSPAAKILRLYASGAVDAPFNANVMSIFGTYNGVHDIEFQSDNKIIAVGAFHTAWGALTNGIMRLNNDGTYDSTFNVGTGTQGDIYTAVIQTDGKILIGGRFSQYNGTVINSVARLNTDGSIDTTFNIGTGFSNVGDTAWDIELQNGKVLVTGTFTSFSGTAANGIVRLNANGTVDTTFVQGTGFNGSGMDMRIQNDGKILVQGNFTQYNGQAHNQLVRLNSNGTIDTDFIPVSFNAPAFPDIFNISLQADQKILVCGRFDTFNGQARTNIVRLLPDGTLDCTFHNLTYQGIYSYSITQVGICEALSNKIGVLGGFTVLDGLPRNQITFLNYMAATGTSTATDDNFSLLAGTAYTSPSVLANDLVYGAPASPANTSLVLTSTAIAGITFNTATGVVTVASTVAPGVYILKYNLCSQNASCLDCKEAQITITVTTPITIVANPDNFTTACLNGVAGGSTASIIANDTLNGSAVTSSNAIVVLDNNGGLTGLTINAAGIITIPANSPVGTYIINYTVKQIGNLNNFASSTVKLCINNGLNPGTGANGIVFGLARQTDGKIIIVGAFTKYNGITRNRIARLNPDLSLDLTFDANGVGFNNIVRTAAIDANGRIFVGGDFTATSTGIPARYLAKLQQTSTAATNGTIDTSFVNNDFLIAEGVNALPKIHAIVIDINNNIYVGGIFHKIGTLNKINYAKLSNSGVVDVNYASVITAAMGTVQALAFNGSKLIIGGTYKSSNISLNNITQLLADGTIDPAFAQGRVQGGNFNTIFSIVRAGNNFIVAGEFVAYNTTGSKNIAMLYPNGNVVSSVTFNPGVSSNDIIRDVEITSSNIVIVGDFTSYGGATRSKIAWLQPNGMLNGALNPGTGANAVILAALVQPDDKTIIGGTFNLYNGTTANHVTRILATNGGLTGRYGTAEEEDQETAAQTVSGITFYPNPTAGVVNIIPGDLSDEIFNIQVFNMLGQEVYAAKTVKGENNSINISNLQSGSYFLVLSNDKRMIKKTIIKE
jgi:uncharacterized delta-60 repeat protein